MLKRTLLKALSAMALSCLTLLPFTSVSVDAKETQSNQAVPLLAVLELDAKGAVVRDEASTLTDRLRAHFIQSGRYQVLERDKMQEIIKEQGFQQSALACSERDCSVRLGRLLGVRYLLSGSLSRVDGLYVLNARLLDVEKGVILREEFTDCDCPLRELLTQSSRVLAERLLQAPAQLTSQPNGNAASATPSSGSASGPVSNSLLTLTLAGSGWAGTQDGPASEASFRDPSALALLPDGSWLIADAGNHRLRRYLDGRVTTFAGANWDWLKGEFLDGFSDGPAAQARFHRPMALTVAANGVIYVADTDHHRIRKILPDGQVLTFVGTGASGFSDGNAAVASFRRPQGLALDSDGNLYVADTDNHAIRKVSPLGIVSTVAGSGASGFSDGTALEARFRFPVGLAIDSAGALYIADTFNHRIRRFANGQVSTLVGSESGFRDGASAQARLHEPRALTLAPNGDLYIADTGNHRIRLFKSGLLQTLAGTGARGYADGNQAVGQFNSPMGLMLQGARLWVIDSGNQRLRSIELMP